MFQISDKVFELHPRIGGAKLLVDAGLPPLACCCPVVATLAGLHRSSKGRFRGVRSYSSDSGTTDVEDPLMAEK